MAEASGVGQEIAVGPKPGIKDRLFNVFRGTPKPQQPVTSTTTPQSEALGQILEGKNDARTDSSWRGPGVPQNDLRIMGEERATSPGAQDLEAMKLKSAGLPIPEQTPSQPTYIAQGTEKDNQEVPKVQPLPDNIVQFPNTPAETPAEPMETPAA